jgi:cystathionine gamma-lyase
MGNQFDYQLDTIVVKAGETKSQHGDLNIPICTSTTFIQQSPGVPTGNFEYARSGNPTRAALELALGQLEGAEYGLAFSSGMAAMDCIISMLPVESHVICMNDVYGGTYRYFKQCANGISVDFIDLSTQCVSDSIKANTKLVWIETPTNPTLRVVDIEKVSKNAKSHSPNILVVADNTFMSPILQNPLRLGADIVIHSVTKFINGHCDVVMGALMTRSSEIHEKLKFFQNAIGSVPSPFDCYLVLRSIKTLHLRVTKQTQNAMQIADFLNKHENIDKVYYPGLDTHPNHSIAVKQANGFGAIVSIVLSSNIDPTIFCKRLELFSLAESLGGVDSLIEIPTIMTHRGVSKEDQQKLGLTDRLIRLSIGIENPRDLIADLSKALGNS